MKETPRKESVEHDETADENARPFVCFNYVRREALAK